MSFAPLLAEKQIAFDTVVHPPAFTAQKRAKCLRLPGRQVAKAVLLVGPPGFLVAVLPATDQVDVMALANALGGPVRLADAAEIAARFRDCEWGVVPPFGTLYGLPTLLEDSLPPEALLVFKAHTHVEGIRMRCRDFEALERPRRLHFAHPGRTPMTRPPRRGLSESEMFAPSAATPATGR